MEEESQNSPIHSPQDAADAKIAPRDPKFGTIVAEG